LDDAEPFNRKNKIEMTTELTNIQPIASDIKRLIEQSRQNVAVTVNAEITLLYWKVGKRINEEVLGNNRAEYGKQIVISLARQLSDEYGKGWGEKQLRQCMQFALVFPDEKIVYTLCRELNWSHLRLIMFMDDPLKREFYIQMCKLEHWSFRTFRERAQSMLYERTAISKKPEQTIINDLELLKNEQILSPDLVFRDPYFLDFLGLTDTYSEKDLDPLLSTITGNRPYLRFMILPEKRFLKKRSSVHRTH
jgi:hypothetical protein